MVEPAPPAPHRVIFLRHAKSDRSEEVPDHQRPLARRGVRDAPAAGEWLAAHGLRPDLVLTSDAVRAADTARRAVDALVPREREGPPAEVPVREERRLYETSVAGVLNLVAELPEEVGTVLVVGHEPTTSAAVSALAGPGSDREALVRLRAKFPTAALAVLRLEGPWSSIEAGACALERFAVPRGG